MRFQLVALLASLAANSVLGVTGFDQPRTPDNFFADEEAVHVWSARKYRQLHVRQSDLKTTAVPSLRNATESDLRRAREIVEAAIEEAAALNQARFDNPRRNNYKLEEGTKIFNRDEAEPDPAPLLEITDAIADAAALVAEAEALDEAGINTDGIIKDIETRQSGGFWMEGITRRGSWPWGKNKSDFKVWRNVRDYGAKGDGITDDTKAIRSAIESVKDLCGDGCYSSTTHGAIIYFPSGTYLISSTIEKHYGTQLIGNPNNRPIMKASRLFVGLGLFSTNKYYGDGQEDEAKQDHAWHINTGIFWGQIRNFVIDISGAYKRVMMTGIHYQVSQATSLQYVDFIASTESDAEQRSIFAENGSGGHMSDLKFTGGKFGIYGGNQQFTGQRITFTNCRTAVQLIWDWGWTWKSVVVDGAQVAFKLISEDGSKGIGGALIVDSVIKNTDTAIAMWQPTKDLDQGTTGLTLDNVRLDNVKTLINEMNNATLAGSSARNTTVDGGSKKFDLWVLGRSYENNTAGRDLIQETTSPRSSLLTSSDNPLDLPKQPWFERPKPQYDNLSAGDFVSTKGSGCKGDGVTDDTACLQRVINGAGSGKVVFVDAGTYILTDTLFIPPGTRVVGEVWSQLAATGSRFQDESNPRAVIRVGNVGQKGTVELQDLIFTSKGETAGALFVEWNLESEGPGKAGIWDCHVRVGGTDGSLLTSRECPPLRSGVAPGCKGGAMMFHLTPSGSGYFENAWFWVADHDLDDPTWVDTNNKMTQTSVYVARGVLIESTKPTWLYGTSSEHSVYYQYEFHKAANVLAGMIQTEQPYYQPTPKAPAPFESSVGVFRGDPPFTCSASNPCDSGWGLRIVQSKDITILGAGLYSWFSTYSQDCLTTSSCQEFMAELPRNLGNIVIHNLVTIGAVNMIRTEDTDGKVRLITAEANRAVKFHPHWAQLSRFEVNQRPKPVAPPIASTEDDDFKDRINADLSTACRVSAGCVKITPHTHSPADCNDDETIMSYDYSGCHGISLTDTYAKPVCCKTKVAPKFCIWRAQVGDIKTDCNGRCEPGEVHLFGSQGGGYPTDSETHCLRGSKSFCCTHNAYDIVTAGCVWNDRMTCESEKPKCPGDMVEIASQHKAHHPWCPTMTHFCCPKPPQISNCHWVGQGDCADNSCNNKEFTLATNGYGDSSGSSSCNWQRHKSLCCTADMKKTDASCGRSLCDVDSSECPQDDYEMDENDPDDPETRRRWLALLDERAANPPKGLRQYEATWMDVALVVYRLWLVARAYDGPSPAYGRASGPMAGTSNLGFRQGGTGCGQMEEIDISKDLINGGKSGAARFEGFGMDHTVELQYLRDFLYTLMSGLLMGGAATSVNAPALAHSIIVPYWEWGSQLLPVGLRRVTPTSPPNGNGMREIGRNLDERLFEVLGSRYNRGPFRLLEKEANEVKGRIFKTRYDDNTHERLGSTNPVAEGKMTGWQNDLIRDSGTRSANPDFLRSMRTVIAVWRYLHNTDVQDRITQTRRMLRAELNQVEAETRAAASIRPALSGITALFDEFDPDYWATAAAFSRDWIRGWVTAARNALTAYRQANGRDHPERQWIEDDLDEIERDLVAVILNMPDI